MPEPRSLPQAKQSRRRAALAIFMFTLAAVVYLPALNNQFVNWDDNGYVTNNPHVTRGLTLPGFVYAWTTFDVGNWIPLTWLSYELDATLFGINPVAFHAINVLLHATNVALLFLVLCRMTQETMCSLLVALLFAVHPLHVESVAWVAERKDLLSTCALLIVLWLYAKYAAQPSQWRMFWICVVYALGLLSKSMLVTVPVLLLLVDYWPLERWTFFSTQAKSEECFAARAGFRLLLEKLPMAVLALMDCGMTVLAQWESAVVALHSATLSGRILNAFDAYRWYVTTTFLPLELSAFYPHPAATDRDWIAHSRWQLAASVITVLTITILVILSRRKVLFFGWFWFLVSLLPVIGLIQVGSQSHADRYTYIPHIGLFVAIVWGARRALERSRFTKLFGGLLAASMIVACCGLTRAQISTWRTTEALWRHAVEVNPTNLFAQLQLGIELRAQKRFDESAACFTEALTVFPGWDQAIYNLAIVSGMRGNELKARAYLEWLLRIDPSRRDAERILSILNRRLPPAARPSLSPNVTEELEQGQRLGSIGLSQADWAAALTHFERAIVMQPNCSIAHKLAGNACEALGRIGMAQANFQAALNADPLDVEAEHALDRLKRRGTR